MLRILSTVRLGDLTRAMSDAIHGEIEKYAESRGVILDRSISKAEGGDERTPVAFMQEYDAIIIDTEPFGAVHMESLPNLKAIVRFGVGYDAVDVGAATRHGIAVMNTPGANSSSVAEHTLALMLSLLKNVVSNNENIRAGKWISPVGQELEGKAIGLIGFGTVARRVVELMRGFSCKFMAYDTIFDQREGERLRVRFGSLKEVLDASDIITLHLPLTEETRGLVNIRFLKGMKGSSFLVNTSRGAIVVEEDLITALDESIIAGAALDVFASEPLPEKSRLLNRHNVVLSPHVAGDTVESCIRVYKMAIASIVEVLSNGSVPNVINPEYRAIQQ